MPRFTVFYRFLRISFCILLLLSPHLRAAEPANLHDRLISQWMDGKWEEINKELTSRSGEISALPAAPHADVDYIRRGVAECRPAWWNQCKAGRAMRIKPTVWKTTFAADYDPGAFDRGTINYVNGVMSALVGWKAADMDNPTIEGELKFTRGENNELYIWNTLGNAEAWNIMSPHFLAKLDADAKLRFNRFVAFRANAAEMVYCLPPARRLAICNMISAYGDQNAKVSDVMSRRVMVIACMTEMLSHPQVYPSIKWPAELPADDMEAKLALPMKDWFRSNNLTFTEDKALREAIRAFATANGSEAKFRQTGKIVLPNGLFVALDPAADKPLSAQREAWIKAHYGKPG